MSVFTIRLDEATRKAMKRLKELNWSEVLRRRIQEVIERHSSRNKVKALLVAQELSRKPSKGFDSTRVIRYWRDVRYGPMRGGR